MDKLYILGQALELSMKYSCLTSLDFLQRQQDEKSVSHSRNITERGLTCVHNLMYTNISAIGSHELEGLSEFSMNKDGIEKKKNLWE